MIRRVQHRAPRPGEIRLAIGDITISVRSCAPEIVEDFASLYGHRAEDLGVQDPVVRVDVRRVDRSFPRGERFAVCCDEQVLFADCPREQLIPHLEWAINWGIIKHDGRFLQLHAATLVHAGAAVIFAGRSGSGKSTLAAGLMARGWAYYSDEFALIDPVTFRVHPFPKALCIRAGAHEIVERLKLPLWRRRYFTKAFKGPVGYVRPPKVSNNKPGGPTPVRWIILPTYRGASEPDLRSISGAQAVFGLSQCVFNRSVFGNRTPSLLARLARGAACFALDCGPIEATCDLLESLPIPRHVQAPTAESRIEREPAFSTRGS